MNVRERACCFPLASAWQLREWRIVPLRPGVCLDSMGASNGGGGVPVHAANCTHNSSSQVFTFEHCVRMIHTTLCSRTAHVKGAPSSKRRVSNDESSVDTPCCVEVWRPAGALTVFDCSSIQVQHHHWYVHEQCYYWGHIGTVPYVQSAELPMCHGGLHRRGAVNQQWHSNTGSGTYVTTSTTTTTNRYHATC